MEGRVPLLVEFRRGLGFLGKIKVWVSAKRYTINECNDDTDDNNCHLLGTY